MARYEIVLRKSVSKDLEPIPKRDVQRIIADIAELAINPRPPQSRKLSGAEKYRLRCGAYRVLYEIQDAVLIVCVVKVGHRREVYRS
ncbi:MAG: type II toxin-antitoxin system RelE/ParE family toxin [Kiritimatiellia bacterium]|jgi:mRNA interferase RelE/StbE|nr:type II toxin-antitoxin system RelE/ParE family toxin [Kiritimatiellia bacterium]MDD4443331.1 type II toxin-antitoxin system RelE/ParE family toxin [Kiritimatiellia bacterium]NLC83010.1 type II toxin-antitoxin system RelE/ParE family toxin [Lentisphaerota bacterium]